MAQAKQLSHHYFDDTAFPYITNSSPTDKKPAWGFGSVNVLTSLGGLSEGRPGFDAYLTGSASAFTFSGSLVRMTSWRRWTTASVTLSGAFFVMFNDVGAAASRVYKYRVGTDVFPTLIHTDSTSAQPFDFEVSNNHLFFANGVDMKKYDGTTVTNWGITGPSSPVTITVTGGSLSPTIGYQYVIAWENSGTTHLSSPSPQSVSTNSGTNRGYILTGNTTADAQVDRVRIGRTIDGGSIYFEHPSSPIAYGTWTASGLTDSTTSDTALTMSGTVMPLQNQNNRPTASFDPIWFSGRLWTHAGDTLYYSDFEELVRGVEEESFAQVNQRQLGREIIKKAVCGQYLLVWCADTIFRVFGDSLATFKLDVLARNRGCLNSANVTSISGTGRSHELADRGLAAWLDTSNTVWITDGETIKEISYDIRPDIAAIVHASASMTSYSTGNQHWLILMDSETAGGRFYLYDMDANRWMPPWNESGITVLKAVQTAVGTTKLMTAKSGVPFVLGEDFVNVGNCVAASNLLDIVPADNPSHYGIIDHVEVETNALQVTTLKYLTDDEPSGPYTVFAGSPIDPPHRVQGALLVEKWYHQRTPGARRIALSFNWDNNVEGWKLYGFALAFEIIDK